MPTEPESTAKTVRIRSYPTVEYLGFIFAHFGAGEPPPSPHFPDFESGKVTWDAALDSPIQVSDVREAAPEAEGELADGFFGARYDRATPAEREYMRTMADLAALNDDGAVTTSDIAKALARKPQSLSPARDGLIKKGLVYSSERGTVAFTVPHFGKFLRGQRA